MMTSEAGQALTREIWGLVQTHVAVAGEVMLLESIDTMLAGDVDTGKVVLCNYVKALIGFKRLNQEIIKAEAWKNQIRCERYSLRHKGS